MVRYTTIANFPDYSISRAGEVVKIKPRITMSPSIDKDGYYQVGLRKKGKRFCKKIHRLVAETFIPNPKNLPVINHKDGNNKNNHYKNLEWCTVSHNTQHSYNTGLQVSKKGEDVNGSFLTLDQVKSIQKSKGVSQKKLAELYGTSQGNISLIINKKRWNK